MPEIPDPEKIQKEMADLFKNMFPQKTAEDPQAEKLRQESEAEEIKKKERLLKFDLLPKQVKAHLDRFVIQQEEAKRVLSTAICDHYNHVKACLAGETAKDYMKQNVILLGPTGVGKTYLIKCLADLIGVPFVKADATKFSETGYVGGDVEDMVRDLVHKADGDIELAQYGIVYVDEIDKISNPSNQLGRDVSGAGVQRGLLKLLEETEVSLRNPLDLQSQMQAMLDLQRKGKTSRPVINTRNILFIVSGAFGGLKNIIERRLRKAAIGFSNQAPEETFAEKVFYQARTEDFIEFGFEPEFIGRLPVRAVCDPLSEEDLYRILKTSEGSILRQYTAAFKAYSIVLEIEEEAVREIARMAALEGTGARGLFTVCERIFRDYKYELPSTSIRHLRVDLEKVRHPRREAERLAENEQSAEINEKTRLFCEAFFEKNNIHVEFSAAAQAAFLKKAREGKIQPDKFLEDLAVNYSYGLPLIQRKKPREKFVLEAANIDDPKGCLDAWIKDSYDA